MKRIVYAPSSLTTYIVMRIGPLKILLAFLLAASVRATADAFHDGQVSGALAGLAVCAVLAWQFIPLRRRKAWMIALLAIAAGWVSPRLRAWVLSWKAPA